MFKKSSMPSKAGAKQVKFEYFAPQAEKVMVTGDFNEWRVDALPMKKDKKGTWKASAVLPPGRYEYRFWVDGAWCDDPRAQERIQNAFGSQNCVKTVS